MLTNPNTVLRYLDYPNFYPVVTKLVDFYSCTSSDLNWQITLQNGAMSHQI